MLNLEDLVREPTEFVLHGKTYKLRPCTLADESWMQQTFGKTIELIFKEVRMMELSRIVYRLLEDESKKEFTQREFVSLNEDGVEVKKMLGGAALFQESIVDTKDKMTILEALLVTIGFSRPMQKKLMNEVEEKKSLNLTGQ